MENVTIKRVKGYAGKAADVATLVGGGILVAGAVSQGYKTFSSGKLTWMSGLWTGTMVLVGIAAVKYAYEDMGKWDSVVITTKVSSDEEADDVVASVTETEE